MRQPMNAAQAAMLTFAFRLRPAAELPATMQAATVLQSPFELQRVQLAIGAEALAADFGKVCAVYSLHLFAGKLLRFASPLMCLAMTAPHRPEALPLSPPPGAGMRWQQGETLRVVMELDETTAEQLGKYLLPRAARGAGCHMQIQLDGLTPRQYEPQKGTYAKTP